MSSPVKLCKDCKHATRHWFDVLIGDWKFARCRRVGWDRFVTGEGREFCTAARIRSEVDCGPEGKLWEPR